MMPEQETTASNTVGFEVKISTAEFAQYSRAKAVELLPTAEISTTELFFQDGAGATDFPPFLFDYGALYALLKISNYDFPENTNLAIKLSLQGHESAVLIEKTATTLTERPLNSGLASFQDSAKQEDIDLMLESIKQTIPNIKIRYYSSIKALSYSTSTLADFLHAYQILANETLIESNELDGMFYRVPFTFDEYIALPLQDEPIDLQTYRGVWQQLYNRYSPDHGFPFVSCPALAAPFGTGPSTDCH